MPESIRIGIKAKGNLKEMTLNLVPSQHAKLDVVERQDHSCLPPVPTHRALLRQ